MTELLVADIGRHPDLCDWVLWGDPRHAHLAGGGVRWVDEQSDPRRRLGQEGRSRIPAGDVTVFMFQTRPLAVRGPCVVVIHDTIQITYAPSRLQRTVRRWYLSHSARNADVVLTVSAWSRDDIVRTLGVHPGRVRILCPGGLAVPAAVAVDPDRSGDLLYVGSLAIHKNIPFLIRAFDRTRHAASGGALRLVGGDSREAMTLRSGIPADKAAQVRFEGRISDEDLERAYLQADAVVQPSLAEGFGLPPREALARGLPLCHSGRGAMAEIAGDDVWVFDPTDEESAAQAIDMAVSAGSGDRGWSRWRRAVRAAPGDVAPALAGEVADAARMAMAAAR